MKKHKKALVAVLLVAALALGFGGGYLTATSQHRQAMENIYHAAREGKADEAINGYTLIGPGEEAR